MTDNDERPTGTEAEQAQQETTSRFPELDELQRDIEQRLRDNRRFLERFLDEDFEDEAAAEEAGEDGDASEEL